ncbi:ABC transporter permease [Herbaspirillum sp. alder98]|uniref:ABC transporter permease n=1 Tax=Herbaspirillum sp. alder98 TaxID=2913096 RepID=UPI001CD85A83|nr:ABC transporter permease [Herbaspirillum sp. alder98]MCA1326314.1 ABC transporter permease [Herbaspirillum sp. alder98]
MNRLASQAQVLLAIAGALIVWQLVVTVMQVPVFVLPTPTLIASHVVGNITQMLGHLGLTMAETVAGFAIGSAIGVVLAILVMQVKPAEALIMPVAVAVSMVPTVAFVPLALIWFGVGMSSKVAIAALAVSFPVLINTLTGLRRPEEAHVNLYKSFGAGSLAILWRLRLPAALPSLANGLRVGFARSTVVVIVTEMLGAYAGIGQVIYQATAQMDSTTVWAAVALSSMASLLLYAMLVGVLRKTIWWN